MENYQPIEVKSKVAPIECCDKKGVKATNCFQIRIWDSRYFSSMIRGHASFGLPGTHWYGFHKPGLEDDDSVKMADEKVLADYDCCCLNDDEMKLLRDKIDEVKELIKKKSKLNLRSQEFQITGYLGHAPYPYCAGTAADFAAGLGCPALDAESGATPFKLEDALSTNKYCRKKSK